MRRRTAGRGIAAAFEGRPIDQKPSPQGAPQEVAHRHRAQDAPLCRPSGFLRSGHGPRPPRLPARRDGERRGILGPGQTMV